jgi:hypothetical protein
VALRATGLARPLTSVEDEKKPDACGRNPAPSRAVCGRSAEADAPTRCREVGPQWRRSVWANCRCVVETKEASAAVVARSGLWAPLRGEPARSDNPPVLLIAGAARGITAGGVGPEAQRVWWTFIICLTRASLPGVLEHCRVSECR